MRKTTAIFSARSCLPAGMAPDSIPRASIVRLPRTHKRAALAQADQEIDVKIDAYTLDPQAVPAKPKLSRPSSVIRTPHNRHSTTMGDAFDLQVAIRAFAAEVLRAALNLHATWQIELKSLSKHHFHHNRNRSRHNDNEQ